MLALLLALLAPPAPPIDAAYTHGRILIDPTPGQTAEADAIACYKGRVVALGTDAEIAALAKASGVTTVDLGGLRVLPGFSDSHIHLLGGGSQLSRVELKDAADEAEFARRLKAYDAQTPRGRWMLGGNWDHDRALSGVLPTAALLDKSVPDRPAFLRRYDGHMGVANTVALKLAGITAATEDPAGGVVERAADGKTPTGVLKDAAMQLVEAVVPEPDDAEVAEAVRAALAEAAKFGVTSVQDMEGTTPGTRRRLLRTLQQLDKRGELTCRVDVRWPIALHKELADLGVEANFGSEYVRIGGVKGYMDGSLGSSTAKMAARYDNAPTTGVYVTQPGQMRALVRSADAAGLSVAIHAIGDEANAKLLDLFGEVAKENGPNPSRRLRIEHAQHLKPRDFKRFGELGVVASMQPYHLADDARWAEGRIGTERCRHSYLYRSILKSGGVLAFGSDWPVAPLDPLTGVATAITRQSLDGKHPNGWFPEERLSAREAIAAYTVGSAIAAGQERDRGTLAVGKLADFVVLSSDPTAVEPGGAFDWAGCKVARTVVGGREVGPGRGK